jgi:hypothetical protein
MVCTPSPIRPFLDFTLFWCGEYFGPLAVTNTEMQMNSAVGFLIGRRNQKFLFGILNDDLWQNIIRKKGLKPGSGGQLTYFTILLGASRELFTELRCVSLKSLPFQKVNNVLNLIILLKLQLPVIHSLQWKQKAQLLHLLPIKWD